MHCLSHLPQVHGHSEEELSPLEAAKQIPSIPPGRRTLGAAAGGKLTVPVPPE